MEYSILFINFFAVAAALYISAANLFRKDLNILNILMVLFSLIMALIFAFTAAVSFNIPAVYEAYAVRFLIFLPVPAAMIFFCITLLYPDRKGVEGNTLLISAAVLIVVDYLIIIHAPFFSHWGLLLNQQIVNSIQLTAFLFFATAAPAALLLKIRRTDFLRIKGTLKSFLAGLFTGYIFFALIISADLLIIKKGIIYNPALSVPALLVMFFTHHIVYNRRKSNLKKYYREVLLTAILFVLLYIPVYALLHAEKKFTPAGEVHFAVKGVVIFIVMALIYRITSPLRRKIRDSELNRLVNIVNRILMSVDDIKHFSDRESFWNTLTNDSIAGLKETMGVSGTYFFLPGRKDRIYNFAYGYGKGLKYSSFSFDSKTASFLESIDDIFEKSYFATESYKRADTEILDFFHNNNIEIAMTFRSMSGNIIGFLFLGPLDNGEPYSMDHIAAFELYRIKLQNLLITGLILDEVTSEQVTEHDSIVVETIKKRTIPSEMPVIKGIRTSSFYINNSQTGGDYFDAVKISGDRISIFMSNLGNSGINSALMGLELYSIFHTRSFIFNSPERVLNMMNQVIKTSRLTGKTAGACCTIISSEGDFLYSAADFNPLIIYDSDRKEFTSIESPGIPLGIEMDTRYQLTTGKLRDESVGLIFSKGLVSSVNTHGELFSIETVKNLIMKYSRENPAVIAREIFQAYREFTQSDTQPDDVSVIIFKKVKQENG